MNNTLLALAVFIGSVGVGMIAYRQFITEQIIESQQGLNEQLIKIALKELDTVRNIGHLSCDLKGHENENKYKY